MKLSHKMKVYKRGGNGTSRPEIRLLGSWLDKIGFSIGQEICVTIQDNGTILIEPSYDEQRNLEEYSKYFDDEIKKFRNAQPDILKWVRDHGYIKSDSKAIDTMALNQKESGFKGKACLIKKNGIPLDVLRDEAEEWGLISPGTTTDEFGDMIKNAVIRR